MKRFYSTLSSNGIIGIKGTHDIFPLQKSAYQYVNDVGKRVAQLYNFKEMSTPIIEYTNVFVRSVGEDSDIVMKEMFTFNDKSGNQNSNKSISLRPEGTAGIIRAIVNQGSTFAHSAPQRVYYSGPMFRYESPQKGRSRQFEQFGVELIGDARYQTDVEIIDMANTFIQRLGIDPSKISLKINTLGDKDSIVNYNRLLTNYFTLHKDHLSALSKSRLERGNPLRILDSKDPKDREICLQAPILLDSICQDSSNRFTNVLKGLELLNIPYQVDNSLVRGLDYYRHTIFEICVNASNNNNNEPPLTVLGGGRYDGLANEMGLNDSNILPSMGWAAGIERLIMLLDTNRIPSPPQPVSIIGTGADVSSWALKLCKQLRLSDIPTIVPIPDMEKESLSKQLKKCIKLGSRYVVILGSDEMSSGNVKLKDTNTGEQSTLTIDDLINKLKTN
ncbi:hypothetical protein CYY_002819 [Polysphondylium violaceum]|uniref:histidine--tRNA ligase n=1 Tax=Polysphondylium violaceum TaxID=133409 RepID=A0A8J4V1X5_9MYCE|nr:hypothetical protein CYY_002819 [Polysphondylium violaceum]